MKIIRSREHLVNLQNYESVRIGASVEFDEDETPAGQSIPEYADETLDLLLKRDLEEALANVPENAETHLETWQR